MPFDLILIFLFLLSTPFLLWEMLKKNADRIFLTDFPERNICKMEKNNIL